MDVACFTVQLGVGIPPLPVRIHLNLNLIDDTGTSASASAEIRCRTNTAVNAAGRCKTRCWPSGCGMLHKMDRD